MAIALYWRVVRRVNDQKIINEGTDVFATKAEVRTFIDDKIQAAPADLYKINILLIPGGA